ncbi:MAG TPA: hypothetical protein VLD60_08485 [Nitrospira sp.]|nr:hypothetical protein [Nitrospira sp.]
MKMTINPWGVGLMVAIAVYLMSLPSSEAQVRTFDAGVFKPLDRTVTSTPAERTKVPAVNINPDQIRLSVQGFRRIEADFDVPEFNPRVAADPLQDNPNKYELGPDESAFVLSGWVFVNHDNYFGALPQFVAATTLFDDAPPECPVFNIPYPQAPKNAALANRRYKIYYVVRGTVSNPICASYFLNKATLEPGITAVRVSDGISVWADPTTYAATIIGRSEKRIGAFYQKE